MVYERRGRGFGKAPADGLLFLLAQAKRAYSYRVQMHIPAQAKPPFFPADNNRFEATLEQVSAPPMKVFRSVPKLTELASAVLPDPLVQVYSCCLRTRPTSGRPAQGVNSIVLFISLDKGRQEGANAPSCQYY